MSEKTTRRKFLEDAALLMLMIAGAEEVLQARSQGRAGMDTNPLQDSKDLQHLESQRSQEWLMDSTAGGVAALFAACILGEATTGKMITPEHARTLAETAIFARYGALFLLGNEQSRQTAIDELESIGESLAIVPLLIASAELANNLHVNVDAVISEEMAKTTLAELTGVTKIDTHFPSPEESSKESMEGLLESSTQEILQLTTATASLGGLLAPIGTTYASAAAAGQILEPLYLSLAHAQYATLILHAKDEQLIDHKQLQMQALAEAEKQIQDYTRLQTALSANLAGTSLVGDPPLIASLLINHNPVEHAAISLEGFATSEAIHTLMTKLWLSNKGLYPMDDAFDKAYMQYLHQYQKQAFDQLMKLVTTKEGRDASFGRQNERMQRNIQQIEETLSAMQMSGVSEEKIALLRSYFTNICQNPVIELDIKAFLEKKMAALQRFGGKGKDNQFTNIAKQVDEMVESTHRNASSTADIQTCSDLVQFFTTLLQGDTRPIQETLQELPTNGFTHEQLQEAVQLFCEQHGINYPFEMAEEIPILGETAKEVRNALLLQLPAVPSLVYLAKRILPRVVGITDGVTPTPEQKKRMTAMVLVTTMMLSGVADNVAAYLFGKDVLSYVFSLASGGKALSREEEWFINKSTLFSAISGGALTKLGNGANFLIQNISGEVGSSGEIIVVNQPQKMNESVVNRYAWIQSLLILESQMAQFSLFTSQRR